MATVKILVKGIALTYHKNDGLWRVLFPWEGGHLIRFKETEEEQGMALARKNRGIRIKTEGAESRFEAGSNYDDFLDMTADYSHKNGVKMKEGWQEKAVLMTVENAKFSVNEVTIDEHFLHLDNVVTLAPRQIGYDGVMEIRAEKVIVEVDEHADFPKTFTEDCTLIFDNDCHAFEVRELSDFAMLYDIVEDADNPQVQFTSAKYTDEVTGTLAPGAMLQSDEGVALRNNTTEGLPCNLVSASKGDDLAPEDPEVTLRSGSAGGVGLPCHLVTASKTDSLPAGATLDPEEGVTLRTNMTEGLPCNIVRASKTDLLPAGTTLDQEEGVTSRDSMDSGLPCHIVRVSKTDALPAGTTLDPEDGVTLRSPNPGGGGPGFPCYMVRASNTDSLPTGTTIDQEEGVTLRDPVGGPLGLPCHLVRASNADSLPAGTTLDPELGVTLRNPSGGHIGLPCNLVRASKVVGLP